MNKRKAILMLMLIAPIVLLVVQAERRRALMEELDAPVVLGEIKLEEVESLKIFHEGGSYRVARASTLPSIRDAGDPNRWVLSSPEGAPANQDVVNSVVKALISVRAENSIAVENVDANQAVYGLAPPALIGILRGSFGKRVVSFGKQNPVSKRRYVQPEQDGKIYLVDNATFLDAAKAPTAVRAKFPLRFPRENVRSILAIPREGKAIHILREPSEGDSSVEETEARSISSWVIKEGKNRFAADADFVHREIDELLNVESIRYVDQAAHGLPYFGLLKPILTVRIELDAPVAQNESAAIVGDEEGVIIVQIGRGLDAEKGLAVGQRAYFLKITGQPWVYEFSRPFYMDWLQGYQHFQDRTPYDTLDPSTIEHIEVRHQNRSLRISTTGNNAKEPAWTGAEPEDVESLLSVIYPLRVLSFVKAIQAEDTDSLADRFGITKDSMQLELKSSKGGKIFGLRLGKKVSASGAQTSEDVAIPRFVLLTTTTQGADSEADKSTLANLVVVSGAEVSGLQTHAEKILSQGAQ